MTQDAYRIVDGVRRRLIEMTLDPPYRFVNTSRSDAAAYQRHKRTFVGFAETEIASAEARLGGRFPAVFREYLSTIGKSPGELFRGSQLARLSDFDEFRSDAEDLLRESGISELLPDQATVFLFHQGYSFLYFVAEGGFDAPVFQYTEGDKSSRECSRGFAQLMDAELKLAEENDRDARASGGFYVTISDGVVTTSHPARSSGVRPLDGPDRFTDTGGN